MTLSALHTDLYELTMLAGYFEKDMNDQPATFDLYFRDAPFKGSFAVFAGLEPALDYLQNLHFNDSDIAYLEGLGIFKPSFLRYLRDFRFGGQVIAPAEGTLVFPEEPLLTVKGSLAEAQFVETALLNLVNFQTLAATKAARLTLAAGNSEVIEFGLRRAQGPDGGLGLARAACIGGVRSTSNVLAGKEFGLPVKGTHAHSWVMAFEEEIDAFRAYADVFPDSCVLLVDTYDTLASGIPNAIRVAGELREKGHELKGVRLDSGDLADLSRKARTMFDDAGFPGVKIVASNELDELRIRDIRKAGGCIDIYGVGTRLATCAGEGGGALGGVYKLVRLNDRPRLKTTSDPTKSTLPDIKHVWRIVSRDKFIVADLIALENERQPDLAKLAATHDLPAGGSIASIRGTVMKDGQTVAEQERLPALTERCMNQLAALPERFKALEDAGPFPVIISDRLDEKRLQLARAHQADS